MILCFVQARHWSNEIEKVERIRLLMDGADNEQRDSSVDPTKSDQINTTFNDN
jgi:hypothetical protein